MTEKSPFLFWLRAIVLLDMNAFFCSIEQLDFPQLRGQPIGVTNGEQGTCIITCSYEARAYGVKTGMRLLEAKKLCPRLMQRPARPHRYAEISTRIMAALTDITPDIEVFSVDEAFLDVTHCQRLFGSPADIARRVQQKVFAVSGLHCSVGVSGDKTTAKWAAKQNKPHGLTVIPPWDAKSRLQDVPVTELCGIAAGIGQFLRRYGVYTCGDMQKLPIGILAKRFGNLGRRIWCMCQGEDPEPLRTYIPEPKSIGHGKVVPPFTHDKATLSLYLRHMSEKVATRLRRHQLQAQNYYIGVRNYEFGWLPYKGKTLAPSDDGQEIFQLCEYFLTHYWDHRSVCQVQVTALDPKPTQQQGDLFVTQNPKREQLNQAVDLINQRYGAFTLMPAPLLAKSRMPDVIAPAWKPEGHRQTIQ